MPTAALRYHARPRAGKIEVVATKPCLTARDLALAYTPGVAAPCLAIKDDPRLAFDYTARGNLVAVVSNGSAVLGLGNLGPLAAKPVMEGKAVLFKVFADIDVFDLEVKAASADEFVRVVTALEPTFGGINLEDIAAPDCFRIENELQSQVSIPVFHDDQHGTAIVVAAAILNAFDLGGKALGSAQFVVCGAGAAGIACADLIIHLGADPAQVVLVDSRGVVHADRDDLSAAKRRLAVRTRRRTLDDAVREADVFIGVSSADVLTPGMLRTMAAAPVILALANPEPEIAPAVARRTRPDAIVCTGRSDYPNQVNNVLAFPGLFRGALDVRAARIDLQMKVAASRALAELTREPVPEALWHVYESAARTYGPNHLIPKPLDTRVVPRVAAAVALSAMDTGVARKPLDEPDTYESDVAGRVAEASAARPSAC
ncbi:MAG TPA: malic enzyme-like NAD(P)-binding protein [Vicinamibacterales bacterium]|nr:malic enzyme-like NAD(P)-binding protein [Vicinamibacterales bacterium]